LPDNLHGGLYWTIGELKQYLELGGLDGMTQEKVSESIRGTPRHYATSTRRVLTWMKLARSITTFWAFLKQGACCQISKMSYGKIQCHESCECRWITSWSQVRLIQQYPIFVKTLQCARKVHNGEAFEPWTRWLLGGACIFCCRNHAKS